MKRIWGIIMMLCTAFIFATPSSILGASTETMPITLPIFGATNIGDMNKKIKAGEEGKTVTYIKDAPKVFKAEVAEDGILYFQISSKTLAESVCDSFEVNLYLDKECTRQLSDGVTVLESSPDGLAVRLNKGTYWLKATPFILDFAELNTKLTIYTALVPDKYILDIYKSTNDKAQKVTLYVKPIKGYTRLQIRKEDVPSRELDGSAIGNSVWESKGIDFANKQFEITKNGIYTFRVVDSKGNDFFTKIRINNIDKIAPKKPVLNSYIKNTSIITGKGEKGATVYIKIGSKTYKEIVDKKGVFTVKTAKLEKGNKISAYLKDTALNKSETVTVTVK